MIFFITDNDGLKRKINYVYLLRKNLNDITLRHDMNGEMKPHKITYGQFETKANQ